MKSTVNLLNYGLGKMTSSLSLLSLKKKGSTVAEVFGDSAGLKLNVNFGFFLLRKRLQIYKSCYTISLSTQLNYMKKSLT